MSKFLAANSLYSKASYNFRLRLDEASHFFDSFKDQSVRMKHSFLKEYESFCEEWPHPLEEYKTAIRNFPKELRQRPFVKKIMANVEELEKDIQKNIQHIQTIKLKEMKESFELRRVELTESMHQFSNRVHTMMAEVAELEENALVQKFMRGETVLSCRKNIQWARKLGHMFFGLFFLYIVVYSGLPKFLVGAVSWTFVIFCFALEVARHTNPKVNQWVCRVFRPLMREAEKTRINSAMFYIASIGVTYLLCPIEVAILTLLFVALGDTVAGIIGVYFGKHHISTHVSLEGSLACFAICSLVSIIWTGFLFDHTLNGIALVIFSVLAGAIGAFSETVFKKLDDNLVIALISAPSLWLLMSLFSVI